MLATVNGGGYGRVYDIRPVEQQTLIRILGDIFSANNITVQGSYKEEVRRIASFCGAGCDDSAVAFAKSRGADVCVSSDMSHHHIAELVESGITVIQLTHYAAEAYGFERIYDKISTKLQTPTEFFFDARFA